MLPLHHVPLFYMLPGRIELPLPDFQSSALPLHHGSLVSEAHGRNRTYFLWICSPLLDHLASCAFDRSTGVVPSCGLWTRSTCFKRPTCQPLHHTCVTNACFFFAVVKTRYHNHWTPLHTKGIEPLSLGWKPSILPLNYVCLRFAHGQNRTATNWSTTNRAAFTPHVLSISVERYTMNVTLWTLHYGEDGESNSDPGDPNAGFYH